MGSRGRVILISVVAMVLGWVEIAAITDFAHTITSGAPGRFWIAVAIATVITVVFPLWRLSRPYKGLWQEIAIGFLGFWLMGGITELITRGAEGVGLRWWVAPVFLLVVLWVAQEADKQEATRVAPQTVEE